MPKSNKPHDEDGHNLYRLHYREYTRIGPIGRVRCGRCGEVWPCSGAQTQLRLLRSGTDPWWFLPKRSPS